MFAINVTTGSLTIKNEQSNSFLAIRRNNETREVEIHHNLEGKDVKSGMLIKAIVRRLMNANTKASYAQRFTKLGSILQPMAYVNTFKVLANHLESQQDKM